MPHTYLKLPLMKKLRSLLSSLPIDYQIAKNKWRKKKGAYFPIITVLGICAAISLQLMWLHNSYTQTNHTIFEQSNQIIAKAVRKEASFRFDQTPKGTSIEGTSEHQDSIPEITYFYQGLTNLGYPISIQAVDSIASILMAEAGITDCYSICTVNMKTGEILETSKPLKMSLLINNVESDIVPITTDLTQGVQLIVFHPYITMLDRNGLLMLASLCILIVVSGCIFYQVKVILHQRKVAKLRENFSYAMIHDMKTPLSSIITCGNFLQQGLLDDQPALKEQYFNIIQTQSGHLLRLAEKVLTIAKLEAHKLEMNKQTLELKPLIEKLTGVLPAQTDKELHIEVHLEATHIHADEEHLEEALANLLDNAVKYSKERVEISIRTSQDEHYTCIAVHDKGIGISEKDQRIIFDKFERAAAFNRTRKGGAGGFGLGLNYVYQVAEAHGGTIGVLSRKGMFSEFSLYIPVLTYEYEEEIA